MVAIELQNPALGSIFFSNALGNGSNAWQNFNYSDLTLAAYQGLALQPQLANINTDNPDLTAFNARKGKLLLYHGLADNLIAPQGTDNYYVRVASAMGQAEVQKFVRYFHIPGLPHSGRVEAAATVPVPQTALGRDELWVEQGTAPASFNATSSNGAVSMPICVYPQKATYAGSGSPTSASSYACQ
jgi:feruloyl esterase